MTETTGQPDDENSASWPPRPRRPDETHGEWAPDPGERAECDVHFVCLHVGARGNVSDFREGQAAVYPGGVTISGKRALRAQGQFWLLFALFFAMPSIHPVYYWVGGWFLAALSLELWRIDDALALGWNEIEEVHFTHSYHLLCIVFRQHDARGRVKHYSITPKLSHSDFDAFSSALYKNAPSSVAILPRGKLTLLCDSAAAYAFLAGMVVMGALYWRLGDVFIK